MKLFSPCGTSWWPDTMSRIIGLILSLNTSFSSWQHGVTLEMFWRVRAKFPKLKAPIEMLCTTVATWLTCFIICEYAMLSLLWFIFETCGERDYWFNCWRWRWWMFFWNSLFINHTSEISRWMVFVTSLLWATSLIFMCIDVTQLKYCAM